MPPIRGSRLNHSPYLGLDNLVEPADTQQIAYACSCGCRFTLRLFAEAETIPVTWDCRTCGGKARTDTPGAEEVIVPRRMGSASKTPWQQLRERRSIAELEVLLEERLAVVRANDETVEAAS